MTGHHWKIQWEVNFKGVKQTTRWILVRTMAQPSELSRWCRQDWGEMILCNSWLFFPIWPGQIQTDNHRHRDQGLRPPGVPAVTLLMVVIRQWRLSSCGLRGSREEMIYKYERVLRCSEEESVSIGLGWGSLTAFASLSNNLCFLCFGESGSKIHHCRRICWVRLTCWI